MSPFLALYSRLPPTVPHYDAGHSLVHEVDQLLSSRDEILAELKTHLSRAANKMKHLADVRRRDVEFQVGDLVYLKLQPYRQHSVYRRAYRKLASRFFGPYLIEERIGKLAYKLQLPEGSKIHPIFCVSLLKKHVGPVVPVSAELPQFTVDGDFLLEPEQVLDTRMIQTGSGPEHECLVRWKKFPADHATWENTSGLRLRFPALNLGDKVPLNEGSNVRPRRSSRVSIKNRKYFD